MSSLLRDIKGDKVIWAVVLLLSIFSLLAVYSSTGTLAYKYKGGNTEYYMLKHFVILFLGFFFMYLAHKVKYIYFSPVFQVALWISIPLLLFTLFFGLDLNDAKRVIPLPFNLTFQTKRPGKTDAYYLLSPFIDQETGPYQGFQIGICPHYVAGSDYCISDFAGQSVNCIDVVYNESGADVYRKG